MTFISWYFLLGLCVAVAVYYIFPIKFRWVVLLVASIVFYFPAGWEMMLLVIASGLFTWLIGLRLSRIEHSNRRKRLACSWAGISVLIIALAIVKLAEQISSISSWIIIPIGISYYTFSSIGYIADIYWKKEDAEKNPLKFLLFIMYFPKIMQGPIEKHRLFASQLYEGHRISYENITYGIQLMLWGLFKKLVVANRASIYVSAVYADVDNSLTNGGGIFIMDFNSLCY